jgi:hypothetical protein
MRLIKHNALENFSSFSKSEKEDLIIQEMSKALLLFPKATQDILDSYKIQYQSNKVSDLAKAIEQNVQNLGMINKIVRLSFLVNQGGKGVVGKYDRSDSYRKIMVEGSQFIKENQLQIKEAVILTKGLMQEKIFSQILGKSVNCYLNMDGSQEIENKYNAQPKIDKNDVVNQIRKKNLIVWGALILISGITIWAFYKPQKK